MYLSLRPGEAVLSYAECLAKAGPGDAAMVLRCLHAKGACLFEVMNCRAKLKLSLVGLALHTNAYASKALPSEGDTPTTAVVVVLFKTAVVASPLLDSFV